MEKLVEGLSLAVKNDIISTRFAKLCIIKYISEYFDIIFDDEELDRLNKF